MQGSLRLLLLLLLFILMPLPLFSAARAGQDGSFGLLYIEANTGGASGGHCALRLGSEVFHFQQADDGLFRLVRQSWPNFLHVYNDIENRPVFFARTGIGPHEKEAVESHFLRLLLVQNRNLQNLSALKDSAAFWQGACAGEPIRISVKGLGLYDQYDQRDKGMVELKAFLAKRLGSGFIPQAKKDIGLKMQRLSAEEGPLLVFPSSRQQLIPLFVPLSKRLSEMAALREALDVIDREKGIKAGLLRDGGPLTPGMERAFQQLCHRLRESVFSLLKSKSPDRGASLLVQMARYQAVRRSLEKKRLLVLDTFPEDCLKVDYRDYMADAQGLTKILSDLERRIRKSEKQFSSSKRPDEPCYNRLENLVSRYAELKHGLTARSSVRIFDGLRLPERARYVKLPCSLGISCPERKYQEAKRALKEYKKRLEQLYSYNLVERNCVTQLAKDLNEAGTGCGFKAPCGTPVPFVYFNKWVSSMDCTEVEYFPNYRQRRLRKLYETRGKIAYLQECNTITSTIYKPNPVDTGFLLFTDDVLLLRPIYGSINTVYGVAGMVKGILLLPFDKGRELKRGFWGAVYSLPELFMANIRKGSFVYCQPH